ncbi:hypothetical protein ECC02_012096 [Trypanosoma cruzi]|uniref:Uncharacterized protein n=1 Tax=Trypanosoma cruzi TaxID=5693 RepID=A0A7J6XLZ5_TRYCR|nr:hypothetical protein ECC02_012096 [Trypanosoma cruzi]
MHHARQQPTCRQTNVLRISVIHVLQWEVNKRDEPPNPKRVPRLAASQRNAATQMNSVLMPSTSHLPHKSCKRLKTNAPSNKFFVQHQKKPQCLMLSSQSVDDAWMRMVTHRFSQTTPHIRDAPCALRHASLTITRDAHAPSVRNKSSRSKGYVRLTARHLPTNHIAGIINNTSTGSAAGRRVIRNNRRMAYIKEKNIGGVTRIQEADTLSIRKKQYKNTQRQFWASAVKASTNSKKKLEWVHSTTKKVKK